MSSRTVDEFGSGGGVGSRRRYCVVRSSRSLEVIEIKIKPS